MLALGPRTTHGSATMPAAQCEFFLVQNANLEAAWLMMAAGALGLDCGPMGGFDRAKVDATVLEGTTWKSMLLINLGYGDLSTLHPRLPRLEFDEACRIA
jgi:3-hydroxypropanoate dehydrogenase